MQDFSFLSDVDANGAVSSDEAAIMSDEASLMNVNSRPKTMLDTGQAVDFQQAVLHLAEKKAALKGSDTTNHDEIRDLEWLKNKLRHKTSGLHNTLRCMKGGAEFLLQKTVDSNKLHAKDTDSCNRGQCRRSAGEHKLHSRTCQPTSQHPTGG